MKNSFSVIIPCHNSVNTIKRCLNSIFANDYDNYEIILIDDKSTDNTLEHIKEVVKENEKVRLVVNEVNLGAGESRNRGICLAKNDYVTFIDSDDIIENNFFNKINGLINDEIIDCVIFDALYNCGEQSKKIKGVCCDKLIKGDINYKEALVFISGATWGKIYRRDVLKNNSIYFPNLSRNEDMVFTKMAISYCRKIKYLDNVLYHYIDTPDSLMNKDELWDSDNANRGYDIILSKLCRMNLDKELLSIYYKEVICTLFFSYIKSIWKYKCIDNKFTKNFSIMKLPYKYDCYLNRYPLKYKLGILFGSIFFRLFSFKMWRKK